MCKIGDIIFINSYKSGNKVLTQHSFIVIEDKNDEILGLDYDLIAIVMSSFKDDNQKAYKLGFGGNFELSFKDEYLYDGKGNTKNGFAKTEQFYYFTKAKTSYNVIGYIQADVFEKIIKYIEELKIPIERITENL
jgi:hypothetical protein